MMETLGSKTLVMLIAPTASGKSTIMNDAVTLDDNFSRVSGFTTRAPRANDEPDLYRYVTKKDVTTIENEGRLISKAVFPTTGIIYGTEAIDYNSRYCLLDTLANSVDYYRSLPFERTIAISLTSPLERWKMWFDERYPDLNDDAKKRLREAVMSISWSLTQRRDHYWLVNDGTPDEVAKRLIEIVHGESAGDDGAPYARAIMELASKEV